MDHAGTGRRRKPPEPIDYGCTCGQHDEREMWPACRHQKPALGRHRRPRLDDPPPDGVVSLHEARLLRDIRRATGEIPVPH
jgi:hypothetical protein